MAEAAVDARRGGPQAGRGARPRASEILAQLEELEPRLGGLVLRRGGDDAAGARHRAGRGGGPAARAPRARRRVRPRRRCRPRRRRGIRPTSWRSSRTTSRPRLRRRSPRRAGSSRRCATRCSPAASASARCSRWPRRASRGADPATVLPPPAALELIHTYSLIHDDLPAIDDDTLRRGRPTCHVAFGEDVAILAGDGLFAEAFHLLLDAPGEASPPRSSPRCRDRRSHRGAGHGRRPVHGRGRTAAADDDLRTLHALKTGRLIEAAVVCGALLTGAEDVGGLPRLRRRGRAALPDRRRHPRRDRRRGRAGQERRQGPRAGEGHVRLALRHGRARRLADEAGERARGELLGSCPGTRPTWRRPVTAASSATAGGPRGVPRPSQRRRGGRRACGAPGEPVLYSADDGVSGQASPTPPISSSSPSASWRCWPTRSARPSSPA